MISKILNSGLFRLTTAVMAISLQFVPGSAQTATGSMIGVVIDSRGAAVSGARVVVLQGNRVAIHECLTSNRGEFAFMNLLAGDYTVSVEKDGMTQPGGAQPVRIETGRVLQGSLVLAVAAIEDSLIVSATRTDTRLSETPSRAYIATGSDLLRAQRVSLFDVLRSSPGIGVTQTGRRGGVTSIFVRGGESDYTKVLIDGVPVNDAGGSFDFADLTTDNLTRVELVRGAQSAIYGSDAMSGVLQIFTHRGSTFEPALDLALEGGSFAFNRQMARLSALRGLFDYSLSFTHFATNGRDRNDDYQNRIATANLGYRFSVKTQGRLTVRNENSGAGVPGATARLFPDPDERIERRRFAIGGRFDNQTTNYWRQSVTYAYSANHQLSFDPAAQDLSRPGTPPDPGTAFNDFVNLFGNYQRRLGVRYQNDIVFPNAHFVSTGIDYETESAIFDSGFTNASRVASSRNNIGVFVQDQFSYRSRFYFNTGLRIENNTASLPTEIADILRQLGSTPYSGGVGYGTRIVPRVAFTWVLSQSGLLSRRGATRMRASFGEGIKAPTLVEAFSPNRFFLGNPALRPERSRSFDVGLEQMLWHDQYRIEANYFDNYFRDQIAYVGNPATFGGPISLPDGRLTHYVNNDRARTSGYELLFSARPVRRLQINGNYTLLRTRLVAAADIIDYQTLKNAPNPEVGLELLRRPRHTGAVNLSWLGDRFDINLDAFVVGRRRDLDPVTFARFDTRRRPIYNDGYTRADLAGSWRLKPDLALFARIENLLNQNYQEVIGYPAYRTTFSAGLRITLGSRK